MKRGFNNKHNCQQKGFTLVELSIVLVIVGLLIGGILVAQSMIGTAKLQQLMRTSDQYLIAARNFKAKYNYWPGDYPDAAFGCAGNGDGTITLAGSGGCGGATEGQSFFYSLYITGMIPQKIALATNAGQMYASSDTYVPKGSDKNSHFIVKDFNACAHGVTTVVEALGDIVADISVGLKSSFLFYSADCEKVSAVAYGAAGIFSCPMLTSSEALSIDTKIDDGMPNTGNFVANSSWTQSNLQPAESNGNCSAGGPGSHGEAVASIAYGNLKGKNCIPAWRIQN